MALLLAHRHDFARSLALAVEIAQRARQLGMEIARDRLTEGSSAHRLVTSGHREEQFPFALQRDHLADHDDEVGIIFKLSGERALSAASMFPARHSATSRAYPKRNGLSAQGAKVTDGHNDKVIISASSGVTAPSPPIRGVDVLPEQETRTAPPKRWRQKWLGTGRPREGSLDLTEPGRAYISDAGPFPSKDVADTLALQWLETHPDYLARGGEYLGAFPVAEGE